MAVKLRLQRKGRKKSPFYHIVAADARAPRDGRYIEKIGTYNPLTIPASIVLDRERAYDWLMKGAQPTDTVRAILRFKGVMYQKHLALGVQKGALTEEQAEAKLNTWLEEKESRIAKRREATAEQKRQFIAAVDGTPKAKVKPPVEEKAAPAPATEAPAAVEEANMEVAAEATATEAEVVAETAEETAAAETEVVAETAEETAVAQTEVVAEAAEETAAAESEVVAEAAEETAAAETEVVAEAAEETAATEEEKKED